MKKLLSVTKKGLNELTSVKFATGVTIGAGVIAVILANAVGYF